MAADHFVEDAGDYVGDVEFSGFAGEVGVEENLEQQVAEFFGEVGRVTGFDGLEEILIHRVGFSYSGVTLTRLFFEARALVDVTHVTAATFDTDIARSVGPLPPPILAAYPHATDKQAREAQLDLERDLRFGWDMWAWARLQAGTGGDPVYYYSFRQQPPFPVGSVYEGWGANGAGPRQIGDWPMRFPDIGSTLRSRVIRMARAFRHGRRSPTRIPRSCISVTRSLLVG